MSNFTINSEGTAGEDTDGRLIFRKVDCCHDSELRAVFEEFKDRGGFNAAVHFAGLKAVGESKLIPLKYCEYWLFLCLLSCVHVCIVLYDMN